MDKAEIHKVVIVEDNANDIKFYQPILESGKEISFLFFTRDKNYSREKLMDLIDDTYGNLASKIKHYYVADEGGIADFFKNNQFDFYVVDSLGGTSDKFIDQVGLPKDRVAFLTSTTPFREMVWDKGYRGYKKENAEELVNDNF